MSMHTAQLINSDMSCWAPVTQHWRTSDGLDLAVEADDLTGGEQQIGALLIQLGTTLAGTSIRRRETVILKCDPDGSPLDDVVPEALYTFPSGTSHEEAIKLAGYEIGD